jgi:plasmid maintenance system killer protein
LPLSANAQSRKKQHSTISHCAVLFLDYNLTTMIKSFADALTEKVFLGEDLTRKEVRLLGDLRLSKAQERLLVLHHSTEKDLMKLHALHYHSLRGTRRYSIDANSRASRWRITFAWANRELTDVTLVKIEDTH